MTVVEYDGAHRRRRRRPALPDRRAGRHRPRPAGLHVPARARGRHRGHRHHPRPRGPPRRAAVDPARAGDRHPRLRRPADDGDGPLQARRAPPQGHRPHRRQDGGDPRARAVRHRADPHDALDPGHDGRGADHGPRDDAHHRRLQVRPDAGRRQARPTCRAWPSSAATACCCCAATRRTPTAPASRPASRSRAPTWRRCSAAARGASSSPASRRTSTASSRSSTRRPRTGARSCSSAARCARTSTSARCSGTSTCRTACSSQPREAQNFPDHKLVIVSTGSQGEPLQRAAPHGPPRPPAGRAAQRRHGRLRRHADPGQRARGQRDDRPALPHRLRRHHAARTRRSTPPGTATRRSSS